MTYLQLVENYRQDGKVKQRILGSFTGFASLEQAYETYKRIESDFSEDRKTRYPNRKSLFLHEGVGLKWHSYNSVKQKRAKLERVMLALPKMEVVSK